MSSTCSTHQPARCGVVARVALLDSPGRYAIAVRRHSPHVESAMAAIQPSRICRQASSSPIRRFRHQAEALRRSRIERAGVLTFPRSGHPVQARQGFEAGRGAIARVVVRRGNTSVSASALGEVAPRAGGLRCPHQHLAGAENIADAVASLTASRASSRLSRGPAIPSGCRGGPANGCADAAVTNRRYPNTAFDRLRHRRRADVRLERAPTFDRGPYRNRIRRRRNARSGPPRRASRCRRSAIRRQRLSPISWPSIPVDDWERSRPMKPVQRYTVPTALISKVASRALVHEVWSGRLVTASWLDACASSASTCAGR